MTVISFTSAGPLSQSMPALATSGAARAAASSAAEFRVCVHRVNIVVLLFNTSIDLSPVSQAGLP